MAISENTIRVVVEFESEEMDLAVDLKNELEAKFREVAYKERVDHNGQNIFNRVCTHYGLNSIVDETKVGIVDSGQDIKVILESDIKPFSGCAMVIMGIMTVGLTALIYKHDKSKQMKKFEGNLSELSDSVLRRIISAREDHEINESRSTDQGMYIPESIDKIRKGDKKFNYKYLLIPVVGIVVLAAYDANTGGEIDAPYFDDYSLESERVNEILSCDDPSFSQASGRFGPLYGCVGGRAKTVKFFLNGKPRSEGMLNAKLMWNDWTKDAGYGIHADSTVAEQWLGYVSEMYSLDEERLNAIFFSNQDFEGSNESVRVSYSYSNGPQVDERLLTIAPIE